MYNGYNMYLANGHKNFKGKCKVWNMQLYKDSKLKQMYHLLDFKPDDFLALLDLYNEPDSSFTDAMERVGLYYVIFLSCQF